jgi:hypothetical protein
MQKEKEIEILQSLKGDTYFAELFGDEQIDAMCENIRNDYPIECGLELFQGSPVAKENASLKGKLASRWAAEEAAASAILIKAGEHYDATLEDVAERLVGRKKCLMIKLRDAIPLTEDDRGELLKMIEQ